MEFESKYESRFYYIKDKNLRKHMADALEFITDLLSISDKFPNKNKNYFYKTCILYTASLIESHLHYCILELGFKETKSKKFSNKNVKVLHDCGGNIKVMIGERIKESIFLDKELDFTFLIDFCLKTAKIYDEDFAKKIHKVRKIRNQIHLMKLQDLDREYTKHQLNEVFNIGHDVFGIIEKKLTC